MTSSLKSSVTGVHTNARDSYREIIAGQKSVIGTLVCVHFNFMVNDVFLMCMLRLPWSSRRLLSGRSLYGRQFGRNFVLAQREKHQGWPSCSTALRCRFICASTSAHTHLCTFTSSHTHICRSTSVHLDTYTSAHLYHICTSTLSLLHIRSLSLSLSLSIYIFSLNNKSNFFATSCSPTDCIFELFPYSQLLDNHFFALGPTVV